MSRHLSRSIALSMLALSLTIGLGACSSANKGNTSGKAPSASPALAQSTLPDQKLAARDDVQNQLTDQAAAPKPSQPQLIKTASLQLSVAEIDATIAELKKILTQQQGAIYQFNDDRGSSSRRSTNLTLKIPQQNLDATLEAIAKLGTVLNTQVASEDVTEQIVDTDARLKNLRKQEEITQKLMDRSGSLKDVLTVSQQLSQIREQIERLEAQVQRLKQQVAYSTINLELSAAIVGATTPNNSFGWQVQDTWNRSTRGATQLVMGLLLLGVGLIPYLPVLVLLGAIAYGLKRQWRRRRVALKRSRIANVGSPD
jgi:archaellum component FlaC